MSQSLGSIRRQRHQVAAMRIRGYSYLRLTENSLWRIYGSYKKGTGSC